MWELLFWKCFLPLHCPKNGPYTTTFMPSCSLSGHRWQLTWGLDSDHWYSTRRWLRPIHVPLLPSRHLNLEIPRTFVQSTAGCEHFCCCSVAQSCPTLCDPMDCSTPGFPVLYYISQSLLKLMSIESMMPPNYLILCRPLLLLPSLFPSIRVFSKESALHIRWPKYWSFSFSTSPSNESSGLISSRID